MCHLTFGSPFSDIVSGLSSFGSESFGLQISCLVTSQTRECIESDLGCSS